MLISQGLVYTIQVDMFTKRVGGNLRSSGEMWHRSTCTIIKHGYTHLRHQTRHNLPSNMF